MILLKNKDKKANIKIGNNIEIKDGIDSPFDLTLYGKSTQETTTGKNLLGLPDGTYTNNGITATISNGKITLNGTATNTSFIMLNLLNDIVLSNQTITISTNNLIAGGDDLTEIRVYTIGSAYLPCRFDTINNSITFTNKTDTYSNFQIRTSSGVTYNNFVLYPQLEEGSSATPYEPYTGGIASPNPQYPQEIEVATGSVSVKSTGKNLYNDNFRDYTKPVDYLIHPITLEQGQVYTLKALLKGTKMTGCVVGIVPYGNKYADFGNVRINCLDTTGTEYIKTIKPNETFTSPKLIIYAKDKTTFESIFENYEIQLEKSSTATDYEPYTEEVVNIDLKGNELCSLPNGTKDELIVKDGRSKIIKRIGKVVLDGSENITSVTAGINSYAFNNLISTNYVSNKVQVMSNFFKGISQDDRGVDTNTIYTTTNKQFVIRNTQFTTVNEFKTWLSENPVTLYYELATPEQIPLETTGELRTFEPNTIITNSLDSEMVVKYYKKFEFDKILRGGYNIDEQEYEIAKKQMANGKRKKILSSYVDCIIKIDLGLLDNKTYQEYKEQLEDGEYEYWSYKYNQYKKANFILTKPSITTEYAYDDDIGIDDLEITLEKSGDVDVTS